MEILLVLSALLIICLVFIVLIFAIVTISNKKRNNKSKSEELLLKNVLDKESELRRYCFDKTYEEQGVQSRIKDAKKIYGYIMNDEPIDLYKYLK